MIGSATRLCPPRVTSTSLGRYSWGASIGGHTVHQRCARQKEGGDGGAGLAHLLCREGGQWAANANVSQCGYTSKVRNTYT